MKKVLVVEDTRSWSEIIRDGFGENILVFQAFTIEEARKIFQENPDIAAIIMDACMHGNRPDTMPLVREMRETFKGPIIAASSDPKYSAELVRAGCDHQAEKENAAQMALELMGVS